MGLAMARAVPDEALAYDTLKEQGNEELWPRVHKPQLLPPLLWVFLSP